MLPKAFCGEVISSKVEIADEIYRLEIEIKVDAKKEKVMEIFNDPGRLKNLSVFIKEVEIVEKNGDGKIKNARAVKLCFFLCMQTIQNNIVESGDKPIEVMVPDQSNFNPSLMYLEISADKEGAVINCKLEAKPKIITRAFLAFISKRMIENKLIRAGEKVIKKIEGMVAEGNEEIKSANK